MINYSDPSGFSGNTAYYYQEIKDRFLAKWSGIFMYKDEIAGSPSVLAFITDWGDGVADFNLIFGAYHIVIYDEVLRSTTFFSDNAGSQCFYFSNTEAKASDSFLELLDNLSSITPDYPSIAQFLLFSTVYNSTMLFQEIKRTQANQYYTVSDGAIFEQSKRLSNLSAPARFGNMREFMQHCLRAMSGLKIAAVVTGGVDSRMVAAHLLSEHIPFDIVISGDETMPDVQISQEIAAACGKKAVVCNGTIETEKDFWDSFFDGDGLRDCVSLYRLFCMRRYMASNAYDVYFGGVCGELYKNSFLNQDFPCYFGKANINKLYKMKIAPSDFPASVFGLNIQPCLPEIERKVVQRLPINASMKKHKQYFLIGEWVLEHRAYSTSNTTAGAVPFMALSEPACKALVYNTNPYRLELCGFGRNEVSRYAPSIAKIRTDRNLTCSSRRLDMACDVIRNYTFLFRIWYQRKFERSSTKNRNMAIGKYAPIVQQKYNVALSRCKEHGVISNTVSIDALPARLRGNVLTLGTLFDRYDGILSQSKRHEA